MSESAPQLPPPAFVFGGFDSPNTTQVPDAFFDVVAPQLTEAELRVALYIIRRTFGFKKDSDMISLRQMVEGIVTKDGRILDRGTGLKKSAVANALNGLVRKGVILSKRNRSSERGNEPTTYALHIKHHPLSVPVDKGLSVSVDKPLSVPVDTQYTEKQQTVRQQTGKNSSIFDDFANSRQDETRSVFSKSDPSFAKKRGRPARSEALNASVPTRGAGELTAVGQIIRARKGRPSSDTPQAAKTAPETAQLPPTPLESQPAAYRTENAPKRGRPPKLPPYLEGLIDRYSEELHDGEHQPQNRGQAARLWRASGRSESSFAQVLIEAKAITLEHDVKKRATVGGEFGARNKMPYYFVVVRDLLGMKESTST